MEFLKKYTSHQEYEVDKTPNVSLCVENNEKHLHYTKKKFDDEYLTFEALESGTFTLTIGSYVTTGDVVSVSYSLDNGETWTTTNNVQGQKVTITTPTVNAGDEVLWKGNAVRMSNSNSSIQTSVFSSSGDYSVKGNVMSLLYGDDFNDKTFVNGKNFSFSCLFRESKKLISAKNLSLSPTTLTQHCYYYMFYNCSNLTDAPELPATTLTYGCYSNMFYGCTSLTTAPELPATTLTQNCYESMFWGCESLTTVPELPATTLDSGCYRHMFRNCTSLVNAPSELPATTLTSSCYYNMFAYCTSLTTAPELPATTLAYDCYNGMFYNCTSLTTAPVLSATTLASYCYSLMFSYCTNLTTAPALPATTLASFCYYDMFRGCTSLTVAPELPATSLADGCYYSMFARCTSLTVAPELPATTLEDNCYNEMFYNCTSLTIAPELPSTILAPGCYVEMFYGSNVSLIICMAEDNISNSDSTTDWVRNVPSKGMFIGSFDASWKYGPNGVPFGWNSNIQVEGKQPLLKIWIDDYINDEITTISERAEDYGYSDVNDYISAVINSRDKLGGNSYLYFGDTFEYNGNTYYLWEYEGEQYEIQYLLTDTVDYDTLFDMSLEADVDNEVCPYVTKLNSDSEETYSCGDTNDWLITVEQF